MKKLAYVLGVSLFVCINMMGCSNRYTFTQKSFTTEEKISSIEIDEMDSTIIIEFSDEYEQLKVKYSESKEVDEIRYDIKTEENLLKIRKNDSTNGFGIHLGPSNVKEEIPELRIEIPKSYIDSINISATDCSVKIIGGEINDLIVRTTYYPIELNHTSVNSFIGSTKSGSIVATIIGAPTDFTVKTKVENGNNNLENHISAGFKQLDLETKDGDIDVTFVNN